MQDEFDNHSALTDRNDYSLTGTFYGIATEEMKQYIQVYLELTRDTDGLTNIKADNIKKIEQKMIILGGIGSMLNPTNTTPEMVIHEWQRMSAVPFDIERAITKGVYIRLRNRSEKLLDQLERETESFTKFDPGYITANPYMLPILQRLANISSKAQLKERIGSVSDNAISASAAARLSQILHLISPGKSLDRPQILQSIEPTLEGIVRDLVGRVLLESIVANALNEAQVPYKRESDYNYIKGVIYDFRADFVIPEETKPKAFIEVRKSSSRHASLYAKDKMFSAINWKGKNKNLLAIVVVEGPWTAETLRAMTKVYDYVVPLNKVSHVAKVIYDYIQGDQSKLRWLIDFAINPADPSMVDTNIDLTPIEPSNPKTKLINKKNVNATPLHLPFDKEEI